VKPGESLARLLAAAAPGDALCLEPGVHPGPAVVPSGVTLWGPRVAVIRSSGSGDTVRLEGPGARLAGITIDGSGTRFDLQEAAVHVRGDRCVVEGTRIVHALFGLIVAESREVLVRGNEIAGSGAPQIGLRGDAVRLWETRDSRIERNRIVDSRDMVVWYSGGNLIDGNEVVRGRYGTHFMYSHDNVVTRNRYVANVVGIFAMYSRGLRVERNLLAASAGAAGVGLGLKESSGLVVRDNALLRNAVGVYVDNSPFEPDLENRIEGNSIELCDLGVSFHSSTRGNRLHANRLRGNGAQVRVDGGGDALGNEWSGNEFDDYAGYDFDGDGFGDVPYELRSLSGALVSRHPQIDLLRGSPALFLLDAGSRVLPLFRPKPVLVDARPWMGAGRPEAVREN
jgi:nitrous oxidase accessory protein